MKITVLGTGMVGQTIASRLVELGNDITMGTRNPEDTKKRNIPHQMTGKSFADWYSENGEVNLQNFADSVQNAEMIINATLGSATLDILEIIGEENLNDKLILDLSNPLSYSENALPTLFVSNTDSLGEQIQNKYPKLKVVKSLNTMYTGIMMYPDTIEGSHNAFISGNDRNSKKVVLEFLKTLGWKEESIIDLGDITTARGTEMLLPIWLRLWNTLGHANFNFNIQQKNREVNS